MHESGSLGNTTIIRNYNYFSGGVHYWPAINDSAIAGLFPRQYISFDLDPGKYKIGVKCCVVPLQPVLQHAMQVDVQADTKKFYLVSPSVFRLGYAEIEEIDEQEATSRLQHATRIKTGEISDCDGNSVVMSANADTMCFKRAIP